MCENGLSFLLYDLRDTLRPELAEAGIDLVATLAAAPRCEDDTLTDSELAELMRNLLLLSAPSVENFYRDAHNE